MEEQTNKDFEIGENIVRPSLPDVVSSAKEVAQRSKKELTFYGGGLSPIGFPIQSPNFQDNARGWYIDSSGDAQFNGNKATSTNFTKVLGLKTIDIYVSNGTTPNGNLTGGAGDICFGADNGKAYYCVSAGSSWTAL